MKTWRDWGKQVRVLPQPNLASPRYVEACKTELRRLVPIVLDWHGKLPAGKKHLGKHGRVSRHRARHS